MEEIAIIGAAGRFGDAAAKAFLDAGWNVCALGRKAPFKQMATGAKPVEADAMDRTSLIRACAGADVILHAANPPSYDQWEEYVMPMTENAIAAAKESGAALMVPGNVYNFGKEIGLNVDESAPEIGSTSKARIRIAMEQRLARAAEEDGVQVIILRAGDFYGGIKTGAWLDLMILKDLDKRKFIWPGPWDRPHSFAYLPDLAKVAVQLAERRNELEQFERFHFAGHTLTGEEMLAAAELATGWQLRRAQLPWWLLQAAGLVSPVMREVVKMRYLWDVPHSLDGSRLQAFLGHVPNTSPPDALAAAIRDLRLPGSESRQAA